MDSNKQATRFRLPFPTIAGISARDALGKIRAAERIPLGELKVFDLILEEDKPTDTWHGVYAYFSEEGKCLYVGKNGSQNFIERIPWHFALDENAWMNHFLKYFRNARNLPNLGEAALDARNCTLLLIPVADWNLIAPLEKFLRVFLEPEFNMYSKQYRDRYKNFTLSVALGDALKAL